MTVLTPPPNRQTITEKNLYTTQEWARWFSQIYSSFKSIVDDDIPGVLVDSVILAPETATRNVIQPTTTDGIAAVFKAPTGSPSANAWQVTDSADAVTASFPWTGLTGTGTRLVTSTATGTISNATTIAGDYTFSGTLTLNGASNIVGQSTFTLGPIVSALTASLPVATDGSKALVSITPTAILDLIGSTRGSILERGAAGWTAVLPGTATYILTSNGAGADPSWQAPPSGTMTHDQVMARIMIGM